MWDLGEYDRPGVSGHRLSVIKDIVVGHEKSRNLHGSLSNLYRMFIKHKMHMWDPDEKSVVEGNMIDQVCQDLDFLSLET